MTGRVSLLLLLLPLAGFRLLFTVFTLINVIITAAAAAAALIIED